MLCFLFLVLLSLFRSAGAQVVDPREIQFFPNCATRLDVYGLDGVLNPYYEDSHQFLFLVAATIRDDGENDTWSGITGTADIGLHIFGGRNYDILVTRVRLYGPFDEGVDDDGSLKYEWDDNCSVSYNNFAVLDVSDYNWRCVRIVAIEGDDQEWIQGADDVVFDAIVCLDQLTIRPIQVPAKCDIIGQCAALWFAVRDCRSIENCGMFWDVNAGSAWRESPPKFR